MDHEEPVSIRSDPHHTSKERIGVRARAAGGAPAKRRKEGTRRAKHLVHAARRLLE